MFAPIAEPSRAPGQSQYEPLVVLIRVEWGPTYIWNVVASNNGSHWYVSGLERPCSWRQILEKLGIEPRDRDMPLHTVEVRRLL